MRYYREYTIGMADNLKKLMWAAMWQVFAQMHCCKPRMCVLAFYAHVHDQQNGHAAIIASALHIFYTPRETDLHKYHPLAWTNIRCALSSWYLTAAVCWIPDLLTVKRLTAG